MYTIAGDLRAELDEISLAGLYKHERVLDSPQRGRVGVADSEVLNFCANK